MTVTVYPFDTSAIPDELAWRNTVGRPYLSGIYAGELNAFSCTNSGLAITVNTGRCGIQGTYMESTATILRTVATNAANANPRLDRIVLRLDRSANTLLPTVIQGTPAVTPAAPPFQSTDATVDIPLYSAYLNANSATINVLGDEREYAPLQLTQGGIGFHSGAFVFAAAGDLGYRGTRINPDSSTAVQIINSAGANTTPYIDLAPSDQTSANFTLRANVNQRTLQIGIGVSMANAAGYVIGLSNASSVPGTTSGGGFLYADNGALKWRGPSTLTQLAPA